jgi:hypothetical protein
VLHQHLRQLAGSHAAKGHEAAGTAHCARMHRGLHALGLDQARFARCSAKHIVLRHGPLLRDAGGEVLQEGRQVIALPASMAAPLLGSCRVAQHLLRQRRPVGVAAQLLCCHAVRHCGCVGWQISHHCPRHAVIRLCGGSKLCLQLQLQAFEGV